MTAKSSTSSFRHNLPYVVLGVFILIAIVGTKMLARSGSHAETEKSETRNNKPKSEPQKAENPVGFRLPSSTRLGSIGDKSPLSAAIYGRESDLLKVFGNSKFPLTLDAGANLDPKNLLTHLRETQKADDPAPALKNPVPAGHVLFVIETAKQFLELTTQVRMDAKKPLGERTFPPEAVGAKSPDCPDEGEMMIDTKGVITVAIGCINGVEVDATAAERFQVAIPEGGTRFSVNNKE